MTDVVSQLEAVIAGIEQRIPHWPTCGSIVGRSDAEGMYIDHVCDCAKSTRVRSEIARCVVESWKSSVLGYRFPPDAASHVVPLHAHRLEALKRGRALSADDPLEVGAAAFRATQEQETQK